MFTINNYVGDRRGVFRRRYINDINIILHFRPGATMRAPCIRPYPRGEHDV